MRDLLDGSSCCGCSTVGTTRLVFSSISGSSRLSKVGVAGSSSSSSSSDLPHRTFLQCFSDKLKPVTSLKVLPRGHEIYEIMKRGKNHAVTASAIP